ncbi:hypothetical protein CTA1_8882 [Colletotrichum tanaceti]|uniref:Uncharacterized protein n=1 Tax=Colletotrichum tanaceti TaxID=1306861 RepID=A0A4V6Y9D9_9PEZI|nr:hypothetical protein CTA1_8882 [Colletotrichum tanaceti]
MRRHYNTLSMSPFLVHSFTTILASRKELRRVHLCKDENHRARSATLLPYSSSACFETATG